MSGKKQWYAMKKRLQKEGKWTGKAPAHKVPAREEGEPPEKQSRDEPVPEAPANQEAAAAEGTEDPGEGTSKQTQGKFLVRRLWSLRYFTDWRWQLTELQQDSLSWYGSIPSPGDSQIWMKSNAVLRKRNCSKTPVLYYAGDGEWIRPLWTIAGIHTPSSAVPVLWLVQRPYFGL
nr:hypothetical protein [Phasianus chaphamaparvovirus]